MYAKGAKRMCFKCGKQDHFGRACKTIDKRIDERVCYNCHKASHLMVQCKAHRHKYNNYHYKCYNIFYKNDYK